MPEDMNLGQAMAILLTRTMLNEHFDGWLERGVVLRAETRTGSQYNIELHPGGESEVLSTNEGDFNVRPGSAILNGTKTAAAFVGYNQISGTFLLLDKNKLFLRRSSSMAKIIQTDLVG